LGGRDFRELRDRQQEKADRAGEHKDRGDRRRKDRALDEEIDHQRRFSDSFDSKASARNLSNLSSSKAPIRNRRASAGIGGRAPALASATDFAGSPAR
jgi:hypothetical protein